MIPAPRGVQVLKLLSTELDADLRLVIMYTILKEDDMLNTSTETENIAIFWTLGERRIQVYNDRHVGFMFKTSHQETTLFNLEGGQAAEL